MSGTPAEALHALAANHRWTWHAPTRALLEQLPGRDDPGTHPAAVLDTIDGAELDAFTAANQATILSLHEELSALTAGAEAPPSIAYFSPEFGVAAEVAQYSGGLGILAGDHLKAASDVGIPLLGIGLFYRDGFFRQDIEDGRQLERYETIEPEAVGAADTGVVVTIPMSGRDVHARVWRQEVGATPLYLLDTDVAGNNPADRSITDRLYSGDRRHRLEQELVLGVGGVRALRALGIGVQAYHLNEGHACFLLLELLAEEVAVGRSATEAVEAIRARTLFTTHTPVPAGIDRFERTLVRPSLDHWADRIGVSTDTLLDWATLPSDGPDRPFNTAALAFELCGRANGVSQLHAEVSRSLFADLPRAAAITGITNGIHARTWVTPELQAVYDDELGRGWEHGDAEAWSRAEHLDPDRFGRARAQGRRNLVDLVADRTGVSLSTDGCIIGFARRFATYKRAALLLKDPAGLRQAFDAGAQFVFAGKAHPADDEGKAVLEQIAAFAETDEAAGRLVLVPDYDIGIAQAMYGGCDVWLNNPVRPREACGTSGEKAALNGVLNCSILDGWWADWYTDGIGWAIPTSDADDAADRDIDEARALNRMLTNEVLATHADAEDHWAMTRRMLGHLGPLVTAGRMVREYDDRFYRPILASIAG